MAHGTGTERSGEGDVALVPGYIVADFAAGGKDMYFFDLRVQEEDVLSLACQRPPKRKT